MIEQTATSPHRHLLDDEFLRFRRTARHGLFVQPQPHERRYEPGSLPGRAGWIADIVYASLRNAPADPSGERLLSVHGVSRDTGLSVGVRTLRAIVVRCLVGNVSIGEVS